MGRKEQRALKKIEENPVQACNTIQKRVCPDLFEKFSQVTDPRDSR